MKPWVLYNGDTHKVVERFHTDQEANNYAITHGLSGLLIIWSPGR